MSASDLTMTNIKGESMRTLSRHSPTAWVPASRLALLGLAACAVLSPLALAQAQTTAVTAQAAARAEAARTVMTTVQPMAPCGRVEIAPVVQVSVGKSTVLKPTSPVTRVLLGNPEGSRAARPVEKTEKAGRDTDDTAVSQDTKRPGVAEVDVLLLSPTEVYLLGKTIGSTNVVLLDQAGRCTAFDVVVGMDTGALQTVIGQLLPNERGVRVSAAFDSIVLTGMVSDSGALARVVDLAQAYVNTGRSGSGRSQRVINMLGVGAPQQVMLEVKVAEVSKSLIDKLGVGLAGTKTSGSFTYQLLAGFLTGSAGVLNAAKNSGSFGLSLDAEKRDGVVKILAEPTIMAISGQEGSFLAGGKIFIPVAQDTNNGVTKISLVEKEFGVSVHFTPTVLDGGRINLKVAPEVSELNRDGVGIQFGGVNSAVLPAFTTRRAATTVQLMDGQSFAIGGLIKNNTIANIKAFPILGEIPVLGALFRSTDFQSDRSELVFVITPRLVKPFTGDSPLPTDGYVEPTRQELFLGGKLEGREAPKPTNEGGFQVKPESK
jgi:pilus assembly protein CpaC